MFQIAEAVPTSSVALAADQNAIGGTGIKRGKDRPQIVQHQHVRIQAKKVISIDDVGDGIHHCLTALIHARLRMTTQEQRPVLGGNSIAFSGGVDGEDNVQGILAKAVREQRTEHVIQQRFKAGRDHGCDAPFTAR